MVVSIPACHAGDRGSIPRRGDFLLYIKICFWMQKKFCPNNKHRRCSIWSRVGPSLFSQIRRQNQLIGQVVFILTLKSFVFRCWFFIRTSIKMVLTQFFVSKMVWFSQFPKPRFSLGKNLVVPVLNFYACDVWKMQCEVISPRNEIKG